MSSGRGPGGRHLLLWCFPSYGFRTLLGIAGQPAAWQSPAGGRRNLDQQPITYVPLYWFNTSSAPGMPRPGRAGPKRRGACKREGFLELAGRLEPLAAGPALWAW